MFPLIIFNPLKVPNSWLCVINNCIPRQIPKRGLPFSECSNIGSINLFFFRFFTAKLNAPSPGNIKYEASFIFLGDDETSTLIDKYSKALFKLKIFPAP